jgi:CHAT domain-containing protein/Tfp pilus assembly protein PilF
MGYARIRDFSAKDRSRKRSLVATSLFCLFFIQFFLPQVGSAQYGGTMSGYSITPDQMGGSDRETGWQAEIQSKHKELMDEERQRDEDFKREFKGPDTRDEPGPREETVKAQAFISRFDLGIPPDLVEQVKKDPKKALELHVGLVGSAKISGDREKERESTVTLGHVYYLLGLFAEASTKYADALKVCKAAGDVQGEAFLLTNLGATYAASGSYEDALASFDAAMTKFKKTGTLEGQARIRNNLAVLAQNRGQSEVAIKQLQEALDPTVATDELRIITLENLGRLYSKNGEHKRAIECVTESLGLIRKLGDPTREATSLMALADMYGASGAREDSLKCLIEARGVFAKSGAIPPRLNHLIGSALLDAGKTEDAEPYIKESGYRSGKARLSLMKSEFAEAAKLYEELLLVAKQYGRTQDTFTAYTGLGRAYEGLGDLRRADQNYAKAGDECERVRASLLLSEKKDFYSRPIDGFGPIEPLRGLVRVRMKMNRAGETLVPSEQIRARNFADHMAQRLPVGGGVVPQAILQQEESCFDKLASLMKARDLFSRNQDPRRFDELTRLINKAERDLKSFMETLRTRHPSYYALRSGKPVNLQESGIRDNEYVLVLDALGDAVGIRLIKGKKLVSSSYETWPQKDLEADVQQLLQGMSPEKLGDFPVTVASRLQERLCAQALAKIPQGTAITIVPDPLLATVPFEALVMSKPEDLAVTDKGSAVDKLHFLGDSYPVHYYQSITALTLTRKRAKAKPAGNRVLVIADPVFSAEDERVNAQARAVPEESATTVTVRLMEIQHQTGVCFARLPYTGTLAANMKAMSPETTDTLIGIDASKQRLLSLPLNTYGYLVCATHGYYGNDIPGIMEPVLALSLIPSGTDGLLTMTEVMGLDLNADLAALIACQTGLGKSIPGEGVLSLGRAFQYAGGKSVLMSLWSVAEEPSVKLVESFFARRKEGKSKQEALRFARQGLKEMGYNHPFFWASFILVGEAE